MNASLRRISVTVMALIVLLLINATMTQVFAADSLRADPRNQRVLLDEYSRQRGQIVAGGQLLAYSVATDNRFRFLRVYPNPATYAPVTGFYSLRYSSTGLERAEDPLLNGSDERLFGRRLADFFTGRDPRGANVDTTIKPRVQQAAWDGMQQGCGGPPCKGAVVALEPSTGKILAMVSSPSYDPNLLSSHDPEVQAKAWQVLRDDPDNPMTNRAISETYPPGSTFKVITTAAALQAGASDTEQLTAAPSIPCRTAPRRWRTTVDSRVATSRPCPCSRPSPCPATPRSSNSACSPDPTRCVAWRAHSAWTAPRASSRFRSRSRPSGSSRTRPPWACRASGRRMSR